MRRIGAVAAIALIAAVAATGWADEALKARLRQAVGSLQTSAAALSAARLSRQSATLDQVSARIADWTATHETVRGADLKELENLVESMRRLAATYASSNMSDRAGVLTAQADAVAQACKVFSTVVEQVAEPGTSASALPTGGAEARAKLTVRVSLGGPAAGPAAGPGSELEPGGEPGMNPSVNPELMEGPMRVPGPGRAVYTVRPAPATGGPRGGLSIVLVELSRTFNSPIALRQYVQQNGPTLAHTAITFDIAPDVTWKDIVQVVNAFALPELAGPMSFAGLTARAASLAPPAPAALTASPAEPASPAAPSAEPNAAPASTMPASTMPASAPAPAGPSTRLRLTLTPPGPGQGEPTGAADSAAPAGPPLPEVPLAAKGRLPQAVASFLAGKRDIVISMDVTDTTTPGARKMVDAVLETLPDDATVTVTAVNLSGKLYTLLQRKPNTPETRADIQITYTVVFPPTQAGVFAQAVAGVVPVPTGMSAELYDDRGPVRPAAAALIIADGPRMTGDQDAEALRRLDGIPTMLVILDRPPSAMEQAAAAVKSITTVIMPAKQLQAMAKGS